MFYEVDEALRALVRAEGLNGSDAEVAFDAPTRDWSARRNAPTVNLYLYDIREDLRRRERGLYNQYDDRGAVVSRRQAPRHFKISYLITAWTQRPEDEHRLLSSLLYCFLRNETIPAELLTGTLAEIGLPVSVSIALPPPEDRSFADVWSALGGELKPSLDLVVTAPADAGRTFLAAPWVERPLNLDFGAKAGDEPSDPGDDPSGDSPGRGGATGGRGEPWDERRSRHTPPPRTGDQAAAGAAATDGGSGGPGRRGTIRVRTARKKT